MKNKKLLVGIGLEAIAFGVTWVLFHTLKRWNLYSLFYILPINLFLDSDYPLSGNPYDAWVYQTAFAVLFLLNSVKWIYVVWMYQKGRKKISFFLTGLMIIMMIISFRLTDIGI